MIKMEVLYPEYMNLYGDRGNIKLIEKTVPNIKIIYTSLNEEPYFIKNKIDILYLGPCTENQQEEIANMLIKYKEDIRKLIKSKTFILATGNAIEYFGKYTEKSDTSKIKCLDLYDVYAKRIERFRYNENVIEDISDIKVVGFKNQMSHLYGNDKHCIVNKSTNNIDFIIDNNLIATYVLGPILILNPSFYDYIMDKTKIKYNKIFQSDINKAYEKRKEEFEKI